MLTRKFFFIALAGSIGCLRVAEPAEPTGPSAAEAVDAASRDDRIAELELKLGETRRELAIRSTSLEQASVMQATLDRRIEELTELNEEIMARLRTAADGAQLAAQHACLTPVPESETVVSEVAVLEEPTEHETLVDAGHSLASSAPPAGDELAAHLEPD